jgi:hypothetical protein
MVIANKIDGEIDYILRKEGRAFLAPGESLVLCFDGNPGALQVSLDGELATYRVATTVAPLVYVEDESAEFINVEEEGFSKPQDFPLHAGVTAVKVENSADSQDDLIMYWRF